jgi:hypothetical protein
VELQALRDGAVGQLEDQAGRPAASGGDLLHEKVVMLVQDQFAHGLVPRLPRLAVDDQTLIERIQPNGSGALIERRDPDVAEVPLGLESPLHRPQRVPADERVHVEEHIAVANGEHASTHDGPPSSVPGPVRIGSRCLIAPAVARRHRFTGGHKNRRGHNEREEASPHHRSMPW